MKDFKDKTAIITGGARNTYPSVAASEYSIALIMKKYW